MFIGNKKQMHSYRIPYHYTAMLYQAKKSFCRASYEYMMLSKCLFLITFALLGAVNYCHWWTENDTLIAEEEDRDASIF